MVSELELHLPHPPVHSYYSNVIEVSQFIHDHDINKLVGFNLLNVSIHSAFSKCEMKCKFREHLKSSSSDPFMIRCPKLNYARTSSPYSFSFGCIDDILMHIQKSNLLHLGRHNKHRIGQYASLKYLIKTHNTKMQAIWKYFFFQSELLVTTIGQPR